MNRLFKKISFYFAFLFLFLLMLVTYIVISQNKSKVELYFKHNDKINILKSNNDYLDNFLSKKQDLILFDNINEKLKEIDLIINNLIKESIEMHLDEEYIQLLQKTKIDLEEKELWIERYKARKSFESKVLFFILDQSNTKMAKLNQTTQNSLNRLRVDLLNSMQMEKIEIFDLGKKYQLDKNNYYIDNFLNQVQSLKQNIQFQKKYLGSAINGDITSDLLKAKQLLTQQRIETKQLFFIIINVLALLIVFFTILLVYFFIKLSKTKDQLSAFKKAVENSDNVIVMTDTNSKIVFANEAFEKATGYSTSEAIGLNPNVLKSGLQDKEFYKDLNETIYSGKTWKGRFTNKKKNGELFYEDATITPIFTDGVIDGHLAIKLDVTESVLHAQELDQLNKSLEERIEAAVEKVRQKDNVILNQTKMAALGEMIGNIAHQWRQPLSIISSKSTAIIVQQEYGKIEPHELIDSMEIINKNTQYLSKTIDDFRNFIKGESVKEEFYLNEAIESFINLVDSSIKKYNIKISIELSDDIRLVNLKNELNQCFINLFNNAKDVMNENNIESKFIKIDAIAKEKKIIITFQDNGGGVSEEIMDKIFEPYFTTKHQSIGTGLGLNMVYRLITDGMGGTISVTNDKIMVDQKQYKGAKFIIEIPCLGIKS